MEVALAYQKAPTTRTITTIVIQWAVVTQWTQALQFDLVPMGVHYPKENSQTIMRKKNVGEQLNVFLGSKGKNDNIIISQ